MALIDVINAKTTARTVAARVLLDHQEVDPETVLGLSARFAIDQMVAEGACTLSSLPSWYAPGQTLELWAGWDGETECIFKGQVLDDAQQLEDGEVTLSAQGNMARLEEAPTSSMSWSATTGEDIISDVLGALGIADFDLAGGWATFGNVEAVTLESGQAYASLVSDLDEVERCATLDGPGGRIYRVRTDRTPSASPAFSFVEGVDLFGSPKRGQTISGVRNRVLVAGLPGADVLVSRQAESPYVSGYQTYKMQSDLVDTVPMGDEVARLLMLELNRRVDSHAFDVLGNPFLVPGMTVGLTAPGYGIDSETNYWLSGVTHKVDKDAYLTSVEVEGGVGDEGYSTGSPPLVDFTITVEREQIATGTVYIVYCYAAVRDFDTPPNLLTLAWENSANSDTGAFALYVTVLSDEEFYGSTTITLTATDPDGNTGTATKTVDPASGIVTRDLFHAFGARAEATDGTTWRTWTPAGGVTVTACATRTDEETGVFGLSNGELRVTTDYLATEPTLYHTFGAGITAVHCCSFNPEMIWWVGLSNGQLWWTPNAQEGPDATWWRAVTFGAAVQYVYHRDDGFVLALVGAREYRSSYPYASWSVVAELQTAAYQMAMDEMHVSAGHYVAGAGSTPIRQEGTGYNGDTRTGVDSAHSLSGMPLEIADVRAIAYDVNRALLFAVARDGRSFQADWIVGERAAWVERTPLAGTAAAGFAMSDRRLMGKFYVCTEDQGLWKTVDTGEHWLQVRAPAAGLVSHQVGQSRFRTTVVSTNSGRSLLVSGARVTADESRPCCYITSDCFADAPTWTEVSTGLPTGPGGSGALHAYDVQIDSAAPIVAYLRVDAATPGASGAIYRNPDWASGASWTSVLTVSAAEAIAVANHGLTGAISSSINSLAVGAGRVYAYVEVHSGTLGIRRTLHVFRSTDGGVTWAETMIRDAVGYDHAPARFGLAVNPLNGSDLYAIRQNTWGTQELYLYRSTDGGATFGAPVVAQSGIVGGQVLLPNRAMDASSTSGVLLPDWATGAETLYRLVNGAWSAYGSTSDVSGPSFPAFMAPKDPQRLAVFSTGFYYTSADGGLTWTRRGARSAPHGAAATHQPKIGDAIRYYGVGSASPSAVFACWYTSDFLTFSPCGASTWLSTLTLWGLAIDPRL